jgi:D-alanine-D-alanine ligase
VGLNPEVLILHNPPGGEGPESVAEAEVMRAVARVSEALASGGYAARVLEVPHPFSRAAGVLESLPKWTVVFNLFEGYADDPESEVQVGLLLKSLGLRATGCPPEAMLLGLHKAIAKRVLASRGLPVPAHRLLLRRSDADAPLPFPFPAFLKAAASDSSHGVDRDSLVRDREAFLAKAESMLGRFAGGVLVEPFIPGREVYCGVVEVGGAPQPLPPTLIDYGPLPPDYPPVLTFEAKWDPECPAYEMTPTHCPAPISPELTAHLQGLCSGAFRALRCRGYARVDLREGADGAWSILELNPNPSLATLLPQAQARGWEYEDLVVAILRAAVEGEPWR